jgi:hypothetical protein
MKATAAFLATSALCSTVLGAAVVKPRDSCTYQYLPTLWNIAQHVPETPSGPQTSTINIQQDIGRRDLIASFTNVPAGSWGCQLEYNFVPNAAANVFGTGNPQVINVFALPSALPASPTWDNIQPITGSLVGTWQFPTGADLQKPKKIFINTFNCASTMNFRFAVANGDAVKGGINDVDTVSSGLTIAHNC